MKHTGENVVRIEADALRALADRIAGPMAAAFQRAVDLMFCCAGRVVVTGMGKSGLIARKIAATLSSTGSPALYLHPVEALHGDLGMVVRGDVVLALSASGETEEILALLATIKRLQVPLISMTGDELCNPQPSQNTRSLDFARDDKGKKLSTLAAAADVALDCSIAQEACSLGLAPTASTTTMLALGDALAVTLSERRGFKEEDFANLHPGGKLGKRLARVESLMHSGDALPRVSPATKMPCDLRNVAQKAGRDGGRGGGEVGGDRQRWRFAALAREARKRRNGSYRGRGHDPGSQDDWQRCVRRHGDRRNGRKEDHIAAGRRWQSPDRGDCPSP